MLIAQITDTHLVLGGRKLAGRFDTEAAFDRLMQSLADQPVKPDLILFSGDLCEDAGEAECLHIGRALRSLGIPVLAVPGNHDARAPMLKGLEGMVEETGSGHLCVEDASRSVTILGLDTLVDGAPQGALCTARLAWLEDALSRNSGEEILIFMHPPPIATGQGNMDAIALGEGRPRFAELVAGHGGIKGILCGHMHRAITGSLAGVPVFIASSASHQLALDLREGQPYRFSTDPAQYALHIVEPGKPIVSHLVTV